MVIKIIQSTSYIGKNGLDITLCEALPDIFPITWKSMLYFPSKLFLSLQVSSNYNIGISPEGHICVLVTVKPDILDVFSCLLVFSRPLVIISNGKTFVDFYLPSTYSTNLDF